MKIITCGMHCWSDQISFEAEKWSWRKSVAIAFNTLSRQSHNPNLQGIKHPHRGSAQTMCSLISKQWQRLTFFVSIVWLATNDRYWRRIFHSGLLLKHGTISNFLISHLPNPHRRPVYLGWFQGVLFSTKRLCCFMFGVLVMQWCLSAESNLQMGKMWVWRHFGTGWRQRHAKLRKREKGYLTCWWLLEEL